MIKRRTNKQDDRRDRTMKKIARRLRVDPVTGCHLWTGPTSGTSGRGKGYGRMSLDGQTVAVHLVVFCYYFGFIPGKKQVDHLCHNRLCCNPDHLELVTHKENQRRRKPKPAQLKVSPHVEQFLRSILPPIDPAKQASDLFQGHTSRIGGH